jgi:penicillin-binding protein 1A
MKIERAFSKERILELYLNEIYLGMGAYGVAAASLLYFDKSVHELSAAEAAYLAALPKAPNNYHPFRQRERALERRNYVLDRMAEDHYITAQEAEKAKKEPLKVTPRPTGAHSDVVALKMRPMTSPSVTDDVVVARRGGSLLAMSSGPNE